MLNYSIVTTSSVHSETSLLSSSPSLSSARIKRVVSLSCDEDGSSSSRRRESNNNSNNNVTFSNNKNKHENDSNIHDHNNPTAVPNKRRRFMRRGSRCPSMFTVLPTTIINDPDDDDDDKIQPKFYYSSPSAVVVVDCNSRHSYSNSHSRQEDDDDDEFVSYYRCSTRRLPITAPPRITNTISPNNHFSPASSKKSSESMSRKMASLIIKANNIMDSPSYSPSRKSKDYFVKHNRR